MRLLSTAAASLDGDAGFWICIGPVGCCLWQTTPRRNVGAALALDDVQEIPCAKYQDSDHQDENDESDRLVAHHLLEVLHHDLPPHAVGRSSLGVCVLPNKAGRRRRGSRGARTGSEVQEIDELGFIESDATFPVLIMLFPLMLATGGGGCGRPEGAYSGRTLNGSITGMGVPCRL